MMDVLEVVTTVVVGLMVGVELSVPLFINPVLNALPEDCSQLARAHAGRRGGAAMPPWYVGSLVLVGTWAVAGWHRPGTPLVITAAALLLVSIAMSVLLLVPINNLSKTWTPENRPTDWRQQLNRWDRLHHVRVAVIIAAFALLVTAVA